MTLTNLKKSTSKMSKIKDYGEGKFAFKCPGCKCEHIYYVNSQYWTKVTGKVGWSFNNNFDKPTFSPSLLNQWGKYADPKFEEDPDFPNSSGICHLFVTNGQIQYCGDCTHDLSGKIVDMEDI